MESFEGVKRRLELRGTEDGVKVIDDFAHHPTAIEETLKAQRSVQREGRIIAVLEPRSNTMKLGSMKDKLPGSLELADEVVCFQSPAVHWDVAEALKPLGNKAKVFSHLEEVAEAAVKTAEPGDTILVMSNGGFGNIHEKLLNALRQRSINE